MHVLPPRMSRVRYYGFYTNRNRNVDLKRCQELLGVAERPEPDGRGRRTLLDASNDWNGDADDEDRRPMIRPPRSVPNAAAGRWSGSSTSRRRPAGGCNSICTRSPNRPGRRSRPFIGLSHGRREEECEMRVASSQRLPNTPVSLPAGDGRHSRSAPSVPMAFKTATGGPSNHVPANKKTTRLRSIRRALGSNRWRHHRQRPLCGPVVSIR